MGGRQVLRYETAPSTTHTQTLEMSRRARGKIVGRIAAKPRTAHSRHLASHQPPSVLPEVKANATTSCVSVRTLGLQHSLCHPSARETCKLYYFTSLRPRILDLFSRVLWGYREHHGPLTGLKSYWKARVSRHSAAWSVVRGGDTEAPPQPPVRPFQEKTPSEECRRVPNTAVSWDFFGEVSVQGGSVSLYA